MDKKAVLAWLKRHGTKATRKGMARYAIPSDHAFGVTMANLKVLAKQARAESRAGRRTLGHRLVRGPHAGSVGRRAGPCHARRRWTAGAGTSTTGASATPCALPCSTARRTPGRRSRSGPAGAMSSSSARPLRCCGGSRCMTSAPTTRRSSEPCHSSNAPPAIDRHFVKKAVNMALRAIGKRNLALNAAAVAVARRLADSVEVAPRWVGKDALRELTSPAVTRRLAISTAKRQRGAEKGDGKRQ